MMCCRRVRIFVPHKCDCCDTQDNSQPPAAAAAAAAAFFLFGGLNPEPSAPTPPSRPRPRSPASGLATHARIRVMSGANILHLYRNILAAAKYFPSKKRDRIIDGIKAEFRDSRVRVLRGTTHERVAGGHAAPCKSAWGAHAGPWSIDHRRHTRVRAPTTRTSIARRL
jgi:hypothetical protein